MSEIPRNLPYEKRERVIIHGLQSAQHYNNQIGIVQGFDDSKTRFEVHINGKRIAVAPQNLKPEKARDKLSFFDGSHYAEDLESRQFSDEASLNRVKANEEWAFYSCRVTFYNLLLVEVNLKSLSFIRNDYKLIMKSHYGLLPFIATLLIWYEDMCNVEHTETVFDDVMEVVSKGLHNPRIEKLEFFRVWFDIYFLRPMSEGSFIKGINAAESISSQFDILEINLYFEAYRAFNNPSTSSMKNLIASQTRFTLQNGIEYNVMYYVYIAKASIFLALMDPNRAMRNLKKVRKYENFMTMHRNRIMDKFLSKLQCDIENFALPKKRFTVDYPTETLMKCCNPECKKQESLLKQFQMCARCRRAVYCGRKCQRNHFCLHSKFCFEWEEIST